MGEWQWWFGPVSGFVIGGLVAYFGSRLLMRRFIASLPLPDDEEDRIYARRRLVDQGLPATDHPCGYTRAVYDHWTCALAEHGPSLQHRNAEGRPFVTGIGYRDVAEPDDTANYDGDSDDDGFEPGLAGGDHGRP